MDQGPSLKYPFDQNQEFIIRLYSTIPGFALNLLFIGCATVTTTYPDGSSTTRSTEEFEHYVESVFRRQNQASLNIGEFLEDDISPQERKALEMAEQQMLEACQPLNEIVRLAMKQKDPEIRLKLKVKNSVANCDFATRHSEQLIDRME